jgi:hypothetical protein
MQELTDPIKRPDLRLVGIEEWEKVQAKGIHKIFKKTITKSFQISRKFCTFRKPTGHQTDLTKIEPPHGILLKQHAQRIEKEY